VLKLGRDPAAVAQLAQHPEFSALSRDPRMRALVDDTAVRRAIADGDYAALFSSAKVREALDDPKFVERLTHFADKAGAPTGH
jgi:hypothetical protein